MLFLGVNTGTSADAVECVAYEFNQGQQKFLGGVSVDIHKKLRQEIMVAVEDDTMSISNLMSLRHQLTLVYAQAIEELLEKLTLAPDDIKAIGLHGQTIHHRPHAQYPYSLQVEDAHQLADMVGIDVIGQFRSTDIAAGGIGAPLIPAYHQYCLSQANEESGIFLNLGGIANVTICSPSSISGWDIGPANALMDLWTQSCLHKPFDDAGVWARSGRIIDDVLAQWMQDPYFQKSLPKSTGRDYFSMAWLEQYQLNDYPPEDIQATLCAFTVNSIRADMSRLASSHTGTPIYIYGKGVKNEFLMEQLAASLTDWPVSDTTALGIDPEWLECGLFAWLAFCQDARIPVDLRSTTGARQPAILGARVRHSRLRA